MLTQPPAGQIKINDASAAPRQDHSMRDDEIIRRIERFPFRCGPVAAEWRNKGYTLLSADTGRPLARLRPYGRDDLMEILYWSLWKQRWAPVGPFGQKNPWRPRLPLGVSLSRRR
jgi:hypothetical protein